MPNQLQNRTVNDVTLTSAVTSTSNMETNGFLEEMLSQMNAGTKIPDNSKRIATADEVTSIRDSLVKDREHATEGLVREATKKRDFKEILLSILKKSSMSVQKTGFGNPDVENTIWSAMRPAVDAKQPIVLALLMGGGKVPNPLKTGAQILPDLAEWLAWSHLQALAEAVSNVYLPGATIIAIPDAALHTADLGFPIEEVIFHHRQTQLDLATLGIDRVVIPNVLDHLPQSWPEAVTDHMGIAKDRMNSDPAFKVDVAGQVKSLVYSVNSRVFGLGCFELTRMYAAIAGYTSGLPAEVRQTAASFYAKTEQIALHYVGVNHAIRSERLVERVVEDLTGQTSFLRMSVHAKTAEPRPLLFDRSKAFEAISGLLPMHALGALIRTDSETRFGAMFDVEARIRGLTRVLDSAGRQIFFESSIAQARDSAA